MPRQGSAEAHDMITTALSDVSERLPVVSWRAWPSSRAVVCSAGRRSDACSARRLFRKPPVCPAGLRSFWAWLRTSSSVIVSSCC